MSEDGFNMKKSKFFILLLVALMCFVAVFFVACDGDDETEETSLMFAMSMIGYLMGI